MTIFAQCGLCSWAAVLLPGMQGSAYLVNTQTSDELIQKRRTFSTLFSFVLASLSVERSAILGKRTKHTQYSGHFRPCNYTTCRLAGCLRALATVWLWGWMSIRTRALLSLQVAILPALQIRNAQRVFSRTEIRVIRMVKKWSID